MNFATSSALPYALGLTVTFAAFGCGASGLISNGFTASLSTSGVLWLIDAHAGTVALSYLAIKQPEERRAIAQRIYFQKKSSWRRYALEALGTPLMFASVLLTGLGTVTLAVLLICAVTGGLLTFTSLYAAWRQAGAQLTAAK